MRSRLLALLVGFLLLVVACGSSSEADAEPESDDTSSTSATTGEAADDDAVDADEQVEAGGIRLTTISVGDLDFTAREAGPADGELVVLLHGFPQTSAMWRPQLTALAEAGYHAVAPDQRGYSPGARPDGVDAYAMEELSADTLGIADALGADVFHLVGHDWGGAVAWAVAADAPDRLLTMTSVSNPHPGALNAALNDGASDQLARSNYALQFLPPGSEELLVDNDAAELRNIYSEAGMSPEEIDEQIAVLGNAPAMASAMSWYRASWVPTFRPPGSSQVPTMFIWSTDDGPLGPDPTYRTAALFDESLRFEVLSEINHWVPNIAPEDTTGLLLEFLTDPAPLGGGSESARISRMRDVVYCDLSVDGKVWTTLGVGRCEADAWSSIEPETVSLSQPQSVVRDGRRVSLADRQVSPAIARLTELYGETWFRRGAAYDTDPATAEATFEARPIQGGLDVTFAAGDQIVELVDDAGQRWVMQSFLASDDGPLTADDWIASGAQDEIDLPAGWELTVVALDDDLTVAGQTTAAILHDNLSSTYLLVAG